MNIAIAGASGTVAETLLDLAEAEPHGRAGDVGGPGRANLVDLARAFIDRYSLALDVHPERASMAGIPGGALLPGPGAALVGPTYSDWLDSPDAAALRQSLS